MFVSMLKSKIHQARVTSADLNYVGSITIDPEILSRAGIFPYEKVLVVDIENGQRFETYAIVGEPGSRVFQLNGAAARLASVGDRIIIMAFTLVEPPPPIDWAPRVLVMNAQNEVVQMMGNLPDYGENKG